MLSRDSDYQTRLSYSVRALGLFLAGGVSSLPTVVEQWGCSMRTLARWVGLGEKIGFIQKKMPLSHDAP